MGECRIYATILPFYQQSTDTVKATSTTSCTTPVYQRAHVCLEKQNPLGGYYVIQACSPTTGFIYVKSRSATVSAPCVNVFGTSYRWRSASWVEVLVNGVTYRSQTLFSSPRSLYCK